MPQIRRKTAFDHNAELIAARRQGTLLSWNRYENMLPQDGFSRLGLSCFECLMGPCRVNPFARQEERTVCGFTPDDLVYRTMMRLIGAHLKDGCRYEAIIAAAKEKAGTGTNKKDGGTVRIGAGVLRSDMPNICSECTDAELLKKLAGAGLNVVTVGSIVAGYDCAASAGEAEFLLLGGMVDAYVTGEKGICGIRGAAENLHTAVISGNDPDAVISAAKDAYGKRKGTAVSGEVYEIDTVPMKKALELAGNDAVVIGGESNLKLVLDKLALDAINELPGKIIVCGEAAVSLAKYELEGVIWCCERASALLGCTPAKKPVVLLPEIRTGKGIAEAIVLGEAGYVVHTATELPLGYGKLGEKIAGLVKCSKAEDYISAVKGV